MRQRWYQKPTWADRRRSAQTAVSIAAATVAGSAATLSSMGYGVASTTKTDFSKNDIAKGAAVGGGASWSCNIGGYSS